MLTLPASVRIYVAADPVDLRRGFDGLAATTRSLIQEDPLNGCAPAAMGSPRTSPTNGATGKPAGSPAPRWRQRPWRPAAASGTLLMLLAGAYLETQGVRAAIFGDAASPGPTGPLPPTRRERILVAPATPSGAAEVAIPVAVWRPAQDGILPPGDSQGATGPRSVILYAPGWGGRRNSNEVAIRNLASYGYVVVAFDDIMHDAPDASTTAEDESARRAGADLSSPGFLEVAERRARLTAQKASRVLDALAAEPRAGSHDPLAGGLDLAGIGLLGFSLGGSAGAAASRLDPRFRAVVNIDGGSYGEVARLGVEGPYLILNSAASQHPWLATLSTWFSAARASAERLGQAEYARQLRQAARPHSLIVTIAGSSHGDFSDALYARDRWRSWRPWRGPMIPPARQRTIVDAYLLAFFDTYLRDRPSPLVTDRRSPFPEAEVLSPEPGAASPR